MNTLKIKKIHEDALIPSKGSVNAAGYDLYAIESVDIRSTCRAKIRTGIAIELPEYTVGLIWPRSKLANTFGVQVLGGVIDCDYRGEIMISIMNSGHQTIEIRKGDKVCQLLIQTVLNHYDTFEVVDELNNTERGSAGINSMELRR
jgi:dUTP pyrophosphatase